MNDPPVWVNGICMIKKFKCFISLISYYLCKMFVEASAKIIPISPSNYWSCDLVYINYEMCVLGSSPIGIIYLVRTQNFQGVRNVSFSEIFVYELNGWSHWNKFVASCWDSYWGYLKNFLHFSERVKVKIKRKGSLSQLITTKRYFYNVIFSSIAFIIVYVLLFVFCRYV